MIEKLENLETFEVNDQDLIGKGFNITIQFLAESYLKLKQAKSINQTLKELNIPNEAGKLYNIHLASLQIMLNEELLNIGIELSDLVNKSGEQFKLGELSELEKKILLTRITTTTFLLEYAKKAFSNN